MVKIVYLISGNYTKTNHPLAVCHFCVGRNAAVRKQQIKIQYLSTILIKLYIIFNINFFNYCPLILKQASMPLLELDTTTKSEYKYIVSYILHTDY